MSGDVQHPDEMSDKGDKDKRIANGAPDIRRNGDMMNHSGEGKLEMSEFTLEKAELLGRKRRVSFSSAVRLRYAAITVSWLSVICAFVQGTLALVLSITRNSSTLFGFGLAALLDSASSIVVLWRFHSKELYSEAAESRACLIIGFFFLLSSFFLAGKTIYDLAMHIKEIKSITVWTLSLVNGVINVILGVSKICIGYKIESMALLTDSAITIIGAVMSFAVLGALEAYMADARLWYIDSIFGIICSLILFSFSVKLIAKHSTPIN
ncbi:transmembrane protein 163-like [Pecten maximus]|uniref:transmembrane protein 163-like n=1 Tax=Pecten maximus TaxID=6579 RepID=UPI0014589361|nr:transmembrane protein 163-like [Pecten maximus]